MYSKPAAPLTHLHNINRARRMAAKKRSKKAVFDQLNTLMQSADAQIHCKSSSFVCDFTSRPRPAYAPTRSS
jgi:hypothetical protein